MIELVRREVGEDARLLLAAEEDMTPKPFQLGLELLRLVHPGSQFPVAERLMRSHHAGRPSGTQAQQMLQEIRDVIAERGKLAITFTAEARRLARTLSESNAKPSEKRHRREQLEQAVLVVSANGSLLKELGERVAGALATEHLRAMAEGNATLGEVSFAARDPRTEEATV